MRYDAAWFRTVLDAMRDMVLVKDPDSRLLWANRSFLDYYGMTEDELYEIVDGPQSDPDDTQQYVRDDLWVVRTGADLDVPSENVTDVSGVTRPFHTVKSPILSGDEVIRTVGVSRLLDDAEVETSPGHEQSKTIARPLRLITAAFPMAMALLDVRGRLVSRSDLWKAHFGGPDLTPDGGIGTHHQQLAKLDELVGTALATETLQRVQLDVITAEKLHTFGFEIGPWHYDDGAQGGVIVVAADLTDETERQHQLEALNDGLRQANEDLDHFAHISAHDLREPSRRQLMLTDLIMEDHGHEVSPELHALLVHVQDQATAMLGLIDGFRELSNIAGTGLVMEEVDLQRMVEELVAELAPDGEVDATIELPRSVSCYRSLVHTLFQNLITNARKHAPQPRTLRFGYEADGLGITFIAENPLPGGAADDVFQPFVSRAATAGDGLGLSICRRVVERHQGKIWLEDVPDMFSVHFTLGDS